MKLFSEVAIVTDHTMVEHAQALRAVLESYRIRVVFHRLVQKPQVLDFFQADRQFPYTVVICHGLSEPGKEPALHFEVVEQKDESYENTEGWSLMTFKMTPSIVRESVRGRAGTLLSIACGSGHPQLADAFLGAGYSSYIAPIESYYNADAATAFLTSFFYLLLSEDRDYATHIYTEAEAVKEAGKLDEVFECGPRVFRHYS
jgi:hypothetical protein